MSIVILTHVLLPIVILYIFKRFIKLLCLVVLLDILDIFEPVLLSIVILQFFPLPLVMLEPLLIHDS